MRFTIPQFIEHEAKIVGPMTFKQFIFVGMAGAAIFLLYFSIAKANFLLFLFLSIIILSLAIALAFVKIGGRTLPVILVNIFRFLIGPKKYIWRK
ncbi:MAG: PrgI family protein [Patescibacteria group bacterium]